MTRHSESHWERLKTGLDALPPIERTIDNGQLRETREFRGMTLEQVTGYLETLGGKRSGTHEIDGEGWHAKLSARKAPVGPSYRLTEIRITWTGDREVLEPLIYRFRLKAFRAPG